MKGVAVTMEIVKIREHSEMVDKAAEWFYSKWKVPVEAYADSMKECLKNTGSVPQWYVVVENNEIIGGMGVIDNDFHDRKDLTPNICAVYVEKEYRCKGIAGTLLQYVCDEMKNYGIKTLYLITEHTSFYERYGWEFLCMVQGDGQPEQTRMYIHKQ